MWFVSCVSVTHRVPLAWVSMRGKGVRAVSVPSVRSLPGLRAHSLQLLLSQRRCGLTSSGRVRRSPQLIIRLVADPHPHRSGMPSGVQGGPSWCQPSDRHCEHRAERLHRGRTPTLRRPNELRWPGPMHIPGPIRCAHRRSMCCRISRRVGCADSLLPCTLPLKDGSRHPRVRKPPQRAAGGSARRG